LRNFKALLSEGVRKALEDELLLPWEAEKPLEAEKFWAAEKPSAAEKPLPGVKTGPKGRTSLIEELANALGGMMGDE
jgi:hypothetical protein